MFTGFLRRIEMVQRFLAVMACAALAAGCDTRVGGLIGVTPPASQIAIVSQPGNTPAGAAITPGVQIHIQNSQGQTIPSTNAPVTLTIAPGTGTAGAVLTGGGPLNAVNGIVNFTNLRINLPGTGYQLLATAPGFTSVTTAAFNVTP
jgi:hypothetical protein